MKTKNNNKKKKKNNNNNNNNNDNNNMNEKNKNKKQEEQEEWVIAPVDYHESIIQTLYYGRYCIAWLYLPLVLT